MSKDVRTFHQHKMHKELKDIYEKQRKGFWLPTDPDLTKDKSDLDNMNENMSNFAKFLSAFFAVSDNLVNINLSDRIDNFVEKYIPEQFRYETYLNFHFQVAIEDIHSEQYSAFLENYCNSYIDSELSMKKFNGKSEKDYYIDCVNNFITIKEKADFILDIINKDENGEYIISNPLEMLIYCMCVERINFSASFAGAFYFKSMGLLTGFTNANELISRDEGMHCEVLRILYNIVKDETDFKVDIDKIQEIVRKSCEIEKRFADEALPENIPNMNSKLMKEYVEYIGDHMLNSINIPKIYNTKNPFTFMDNLSLEVKTSFFEQRVTNYTKSNNDSNFEIDADI
jgi:ribonucleotide reductase beta subunit family protein with ferritin-like domain